MFLLYDVIQRREAQLGYHLLLKSSVYKQTQRRVGDITLFQLEKAATEIKETGRCTDPAVLDLEHQIQVVAKKAPHSHSRCAEQAVHINALMVSDGMPTLWITLNPSDFRSPLVLSFAGVQLETAVMNGTIRQMQESAATMSPVAVAFFLTPHVKEFLIIC